MVKILSRPRAAGKTYESILESQRTGAVIVCANASEAKRVEREAHRMGFSIPQPLSCHDAYKKLQARHSCGCIVDNCEGVLQQFLGSPVSAVTFDGPPAEIMWREAAQTHNSPIAPSAKPDNQHTQPSIAELATKYLSERDIPIGEKLAIGFFANYVQQQQPIIKTL